MQIKQVVGEDQSRLSLHHSLEFLAIQGDLEDPGKRRETVTYEDGL